jgi:hypothetical protein
MSKAKPKGAGRSTAKRAHAPLRDSFIDPRSQPGFQPEHFPLCDGGAAPPVGTTDRIERRQIEFLAAYYRLNQLIARLEALRSGAVREDERSVLREIQYAIRERDDLEDKYEPEGFIGEPIMDGIYYADVEFTHARSRQFYQPMVSSRFSLSIPMPPPGVEIEGWVRRHLAPVFQESAGTTSVRAVPDRRPRSKRRPEK